ncbi:transcription cofactor vestigial-like protein 1 [Sinocyclocheilus anshuiensis]|uniref:transcription cofactor vestigial-like protein 1 n=1 Tax=Sinocyclocheilus anshuiensis TaxID=1608454 RepID=UPI0007B9C8CD|nr:PREDICTED: transcription cofactor vestigial-like protein 1 [Sinocyclocheilus anshuiensis]XP_016348976.1 PREDICTED: transcription cofactor vestigial-like protein 1 [Sinocyclocheilus anshuiensis]
MMADRVLKHSEECKDPPQLFTYYQGDINAAVDEHFFRALNKATTPKDLSTKAKDSNRIPKSDVPSSSWASSGLTWSKSTHSSGSSNLAQLITMKPPPPSQGDIVNPSVLSPSSSSSSSSSSLWPCPPRQGTAFELPQILYQQPMAAESSASSYLDLLQMDRPTGGIMISPFSKSETRPEWNSGTTFKDGSRIGLDSGVPVSEISKDLYWY